MEQKLLFLDLDGTLLNDEKQITRKNAEALKKLIAAGHGVVVTTGRPLVSAMEQAKNIGQASPGCYLIAYNGAQIYNWSAGEVIYSHSLKPETALAILNHCNTLDVHIQTYGANTVLVEPRWEDDMVKEYCRRIHMTYRVMKNVSEEIQHGPVKCLALDLDHPRRLKQVETWLKQKYAGQVDTFYSCNEYLEIVPAGMSKGNALQVMCELLGVDRKNTVSVGDAANDISMIEAAGTGVAMANGTEEAKAAADYITVRDNNHDAIAEVAERFFSAD